jgi:hypothetical protein
MKKLLLCLLAIAMLVPLMTACNDDKTSTSNESGLVTDEFKMTTPVRDLGGKEIRVLNWDFNSSIVEHSGEILYAEENPSSVDDAKKWVVDQVEELYNVDIVGDSISQADGTTIQEIIKNQVMAGDPDTDYHVAFNKLAATATLVGEGYIQDLNSISTIDLSKSWWDKNAVEDPSIGGKVYFTCGDINTYDDLGTWCVLFNKNMKEQYLKDTDLYALAREGKWTYDKFYECCTADKITHDSNGDGALDEKDTWAFGTETYNVFIHVISAGEKIAKKDDDDLPYLTLSVETEKTYSILTKVLDFYNDANTVLVANNYATKFPENPWGETVHKAFVEGRELFYMCGLIHVSSFRKMEDEFGILPVPKWSAKQDRYYHSVSIDNSTVMSIPSNISGQDLEDVGLILSAIGELSEYKLMPAFYDVQLKYRDSRDDESAEMLDIIFDSRTFDLGATYNESLNGILWTYMSLDKNIVNRFDSVLPAAETKLEDLLELIA